MLRQEIASARESGKLTGGWSHTEYAGKHYLYRLFHQKNIYLGACLCAERLLSFMQQNGLDDVTYLTLIRNGEGDFCERLPEKLSGLADAQRSVSDMQKVGKTQYLRCIKLLRKYGYALLVVLEDRSALSGLATLREIYPAFLFLASLFLAGFIKLQNRWLLQPTKRICEAMERMKGGNLDVRIKGQNEGTEFRLIEETFNEMAENIRTLKIRTMEEQIQRQQAELNYQKQKNEFQKSELQYLMLQINPHFYINCLNIIHNMSITGENGLIQKMTAYLGNHLRYTLEGNVTEELRTEVEYVQNYIHIQELRFGDALHVHMEIEPGLWHVPVPPLVIQTFVENTVKYEVVPGEKTEMYILASWENYPDTDRILIEIWDDGEGYTPEILNRLTSGEKLWRNKKERFGIRNLATRIRLIYREEAGISFSNHEETGGACVRISLPNWEKKEREETE